MTEKDNLNNTPNEAGTPEALEQTRHESQGEGEHQHHHQSGHHHHRSGHGHHHHHSSRRRRGKKPASRGKENFKNFIKYNKHYLIYAAMTIAFVVCLALLGSQLDKQMHQNSQGNPSDGPQTPGTEEGTDKLQIHVPLFSGEVNIVAPVIDAYMQLDLSTPVKDFVDQHGSANTRLDISLPFELEYELTGIPSGDYVQSAEFIVADNPGFERPQVVLTHGYRGTAEFYNLKTGTQHYYRINFIFVSGATTSVGGSFKTGRGPRLLMVDGVRNIRDFGGWTTVDGSVIKQGVLYRGQELDGAVEPTYRITADGLNTMLTVLGVKTDMDLRLPTDNLYGTDALGPGVKHTYYSAPMYGNIFNSQENAEKMRQIFSALAKPENYPIYLHCTYGQDRTGTVCYLLGALLGVDATSLAKDYQLSALCYGDVNTEAFGDFVVRVRELPGSTLSAKVEGYLLSIGVTQEEIASIRQIFLGN